MMKNLTPQHQSLSQQHHEISKKILSVNISPGKSYESCTLLYHSYTEAKFHKVGMYRSLKLLLLFFQEQRAVLS